MSQPGIPELKHQDMLEKAIIGAKDKSVISWWWLSIPLYMIAALLMKTVFMPGTDLISNLRELAAKNQYSSLLFFLILLIVLIVINLISTKSIYLLSGRTKTFYFLRALWFNVLIIFLSLLILLIYSLKKTTP
jgi:hypothetical protein